ncbi:MAG TPA: type I-C CRISPR-associated protein Cas7/Csd2 [Thiobacillus sp.]|nr:type I-C CRISPR-associated protein Cas7/Csd2 [Thiobacillus sp.]
MNTLQNKIDFAVIFRVTNANPNGDPLNGNRPRTDYSNYGEMSDVSIKRKLRDRLLERWIDAGRNDDGNMIFVQSDDRKADDAKSLRARAEAGLGKELGSDKTADLACKKWLDVRAFGQLFALKSNKKAGKKNEDGSDAEGDTGVSIGIRGPVTIQSAFSVEPIDISSLQITKSVSGEGDGSKRGSDTMGMKHRVDQGIYRFYGSMNPQLAEKTGFTDADAEAIKQALPRLFENDDAAARPAGSMEVLKVVWWRHHCKAGQHSSAKVHRTLTVNADGSYELANLDGLKPEEIEGF